MKGIAITMLSAALLFATSTATALRITDSSTSDRGARSTYSSLTKTNTSSTYGYQNSYGVSVGMVVAFTSQNDIATPDRIKWLECNGQTFSRDQYPELYDALGVNVVPNLNGQFMRGTSDKNLVLTRKDDTIKSHTVNIPEHTHTFDLTATGTVQTLTNGETVYVPQLAGAEDTIKSSRYERVKTGTEEYVCGTEDEEYQCGTEEEEYKDRIKTRTDEYTGTYSTCVLVFSSYTGSNAIDWEDGEVHQRLPGTTCSGTVIVRGSSTGISACEIGDKYTVVNDINYTNRRISRCTCNARITKCGNVTYTVITSKKEVPKYCTRTVNKYCTRDVYEDQLVETEGNPAKAINTTTPSTSHLQNGTVSGKINSSGELIGNYIGAEETAPKHTYVRYFIRAIP